MGFRRDFFTETFVIISASELYIFRGARCFLHLVKPKKDHQWPSMVGPGYTALSSFPSHRPMPSALPLIAEHANHRCIYIM
jgi:hypothetical protein